MKILNFNDYVDTLEKLSIDTDGKEYLVNSQEKGIDFDKFLKDYFELYDANAKYPESVDTILLVDGKYTLIEFKNGRMNSNQIHNVKCKMAHSLLVLFTNISDIDINYSRENITFILVCDFENAFKKKIDKQKYKQSMINNVMRKAKKEIIHFGLGCFKGSYFKDVLTLDKDDLDNYLNSHSIACPTN